MFTRKKIIVIMLILVMFIFVASIGSNSYSTNGNKYKLPKGILPMSLLSNISSVKGVANPFSESAELFIKSEQEAITSLRGAELASPMVYKDKYGKSRVIIYGVKKDKKIIGRIVVNYDRKNPVVLEFAESAPPHLLNVKEEILNKTSLEKNMTLGKPKFIYVFPLLYYVHFNVYNKNQAVKDVYFFWNEKRMIPLTDIPAFPNLPDEKSPFIKTGGSRKILYDVPDYKTSTSELCNNCGPTAGANILGYWHKNGYYYLQHDWDESDGHSLMDCLWYDMNTSCVYGTPASNFRSGIVHHANTVHNGYLGIYHFSASGDSYPTFSDAVREINANRPFGILMRKRKHMFTFHWLTCIGYDSLNDNYIYVRNGWGGGLVDIKWYDPYLYYPDEDKWWPIYIDGFDYVYLGY